MEIFWTKKNVIAVKIFFQLVSIFIMKMQVSGNLDEYDQNGLRMDGDESGKHSCLCIRQIFFFF